MRVAPLALALLALTATGCGAGHKPTSTVTVTVSTSSRPKPRLNPSLRHTLANARRADVRCALSWNAKPAGEVSNPAWKGRAVWQEAYSFAEEAAQVQGTAYNSAAWKQVQVSSDFPHPGCFVEIVGSGKVGYPVQAYTNFQSARGCGQYGCHPEGWAEPWHPDYVTTQRFAAVIRVLGPPRRYNAMMALASQDGVYVGQILKPNGTPFPSSPGTARSGAPSTTSPLPSGTAAPPVQVRTDALPLPHSAFFQYVDVITLGRPCHLVRLRYLWQFQSPEPKALPPLIVPIGDAAIPEFQKARVRSARWLTQQIRSLHQFAFPVQGGIQRVRDYVLPVPDSSWFVYVGRSEAARLEHNGVQCVS